MRIAALVGDTSRQGGGMATAALALCRALSERGDEVVIFSWPRQEPAPPEMTLQTFQLTGPSRFEFSLDIDRLLDEGKFDLVHTHGLWTYRSVAALRWHKRTHKPLVISPHGALHHSALSNSAWKKVIARAAFEQRHLESASCVHVLNDAEDAAVRHQGIRQPTAIIPNGVDHADRASQAEQPSWAKGDDRRILLFLGRIHPKKGIDELIAAWRRVIDAAPDVAVTWRVVIAGWDDGGCRPALEENVRRLGLTEQIAFVGAVYGKEKRAAFLHSAAFILPSHTEGLPMTVLEAWSHGLPAIMTNECNLPEGFEAGAAFHIKSEPAAMADRLIDILDDEVALREAGERGADLVRRTYSWEKVAERMHSLYASLISAAQRCGNCQEPLHDNP